MDASNNEHKLAFLLFLSFFTVVTSWNIALSVTTQVSDAVGGEPFGAQPLVTVYDRKGNLQHSLVGNMHASIQESPTYHKTLWKEGALADESSYLATLVGGQAVFTGLGIDRAGVGYKLRFELRDEHNISLGEVLSETFDVMVGPAYQIGVVVNPETAYGGTLWSTQPAVAVQDRGFNTVPSINSGTVTVSLLETGSSAVLRSNQSMTMAWIDGEAHFNGLYINEAGYQNILTFVTDLPLPGQSTCASLPFSVGIGPAAKLVFLDEASAGPAFGGKAFANQPCIEVRDMGGNKLIGENNLLIAAALHSNPSSGTLSPDSNRYAPVLEGIAQFRSLSIDKTGIGYRLSYTLIRQKSERLIETKVVALGSYFDVNIGTPHRLAVLKNPSGAWAGNQPFKVQPKIGLLDSGGNVVRDDSTTFVESFVTPSLSHESQIIIDTSQDEVPSVISVFYSSGDLDDPRLMYAPGDVITVEVEFSQEVTVLPTSSELQFLPSLELNVISNSTGPQYAKAELVSSLIGKPTRILVFKYEVLAGHSQLLLDYTSNSSLVGNDHGIFDGLGRAVNLVLPTPGSGTSLANSKIISVSDDPAFITEITATAPPGEYGAGHEIDIVVSFSRHVMVSGSPKLPLNVRSTVVIIDTQTGGVIETGSFFFIVYKHKMSKKIPWNASARHLKHILEEMQTVLGDICVHRSLSESAVGSGGYRWTLQFENLSEEPLVDDFLVDYSGMVFSDFGSSQIIISTEVADIDSDSTNACTSRRAEYKNGSGTASLVFQYTILPGDETSSLNIADGPGSQFTFSSQLDNIFLATNTVATSTTNCNPYLQNITFSNQAGIVVGTMPPAVQYITPQASTTPNGSYAVGDTLYFEVVFNKPVSVKKGLRLELDTGFVKGIAKYDSGSDTQTLLLKYAVEEGQVSTDLNYAGPYALVAENMVVGSVRRSSTSPTTNARLTLSSIETSLADVSDIIIDGVRPTIQKISFDLADAGRVFVEREDISIFVEFSAPVVVSSGPPVLIVVVGGEEREAGYISGSGSTILEFVYKVIVGDTSIAPDFSYKMICTSPGCLNTLGSIRRLSANPLLDADLSINLTEDFAGSGIPIANQTAGVHISTSGATSVVVSVETSKEDGTFGVGEDIRLEVHFSDIVYCNGTMPQLLANFGSSNRLIAYETGSGSSILTFRHVTTVEDTTNGLEWVFLPGSNSALFCDKSDNPQCDIKNGNGDDVNLAFLDLSHGINVPQLSTSISIDASVPTITSVYMNKTKPSYCIPNNMTGSSCSYTIGEVIPIFVDFDVPVIVTGPGPRLLLSVGKTQEAEVLDGSYALYDADLSTETKLCFLYVVSEGHSSSGKNLAYTCTQIQCSLDSREQGLTSIMRKSSFPSTPANLSLPIPSPSGISTNSQNLVIIDTGKRPEVTKVFSLTENGTYAPGDTIQIGVRFSEAVVVSGVPFLNLDVGGGEIATADFVSGSGTQQLLFDYFVEESHFSLDLGYVDSHSLQLGTDGVYIGSIKQASTYPEVDANLRLMNSGSPGSLLANSDIVIDSREPYVMSLWSPQSRGKYHTDDVISIYIQFSTPIIVSGDPSVLLETGAVDRLATFASQLNDTTLVFEYIVELGDDSRNLDYWTNEGLERISSSSFRLNGGSIKRKSAHPIIDADVHLNPSFGFLDGTVACRLNEGIASFGDLRIGQRGHDFKIRFRAIPNSTGVMTESMALARVGLSSEFEVIGEQFDRDIGDLFGASTSLDGQLLAIGAPHKRIPTPEVQILSVFSETPVIQNEVQIVTTELNRTEATISIQSFRTNAQPGQRVEGSFSLQYSVNNTYMYASPIEVPASAGAEQLKTIIEEAFPILGSIETSRAPNNECNCNNAWTWSITFTDASSGLTLFDINGNGLSGGGANISASEFTRKTNMLNGSFSLINPYTGEQSRHIPYYSSRTLMKAILEEDLSLHVKDVLVANTDSDRDMPELGRRWAITFSHHRGPFGDDANVPSLQINSDELRGAGSFAWTHVGFEGRGPLSGQFALSLRGSEFSSFIPHNSSSELVKTALESLSSVNLVEVSSRQKLETNPGLFGYLWVITFLSVNHLTDYGWQRDPGGESTRGNLPALLVKSQLIGWNANSTVQYEFGSGTMDTQAQWMLKKRGDNGLQSGKVDVFRKEGELWKNEASLVANDHNSYDKFGYSVSLKNSFVVVGAPSKEVDGIPEEQSLICLQSATCGTFKISFRGFESTPLPYNATRKEIEDAMIGHYRDTTQLHTLPHISVLAVDEWDNADTGFCEEAGNTALITFLTPDGGGVSTAEQRNGDIEILNIELSSDFDGKISVIESQKGSRSPTGKDLEHTQPTSKQAGSAYIYHRTLACELCSYQWSQVKKVTPLEGNDFPTDSAQFGWSVATDVAKDRIHQVVAIGSPGFSHSSGKVYLFYGLNESWAFHGILTNEVWGTPTNGDRFGDSIQIEGDTIFVSAPGNSEGRGAVYIFRQRNDGTEFLSSQALHGPKDLEKGDNFGFSFALSGNDATICAPYKKDKTIYAGKVPIKGTSVEVGSCFVYSRAEPRSSYQFRQQLAPSNVKPRDRFGWSVAMFGSRVLVGQLQNFVGKRVAPRPVQTLRIYCKRKFCTKMTGSTVRLSWREGVEPMHTRPLQMSVSANRLQDALEEDLKTGPLSVSRTAMPDINGGYSWSITFDSFSSYTRKASTMPVMACDDSELRESGMVCDVNIQQDIPQAVRGKSHLFTRDAVGLWTEQCFLFPSVPQKQDMFGSSVSLGDDVAVVGATNRELLNINSGSAIIFDIGFINFTFASEKYHANEGDSIEIALLRSSTANRQIIGVRTIDRNAENSLQYFIDELFSFRSSELFPFDETPVDKLNQNTAFGRSQYYGSAENRSMWVNGMFDYRGIADYKLLNEECLAERGQENVTIELETNNDSISENPDEKFSVQVAVPGMFASQLGDLTTDVIIKDDDGLVGPNNQGIYYKKLLGYDTEPGDRFGTAVDIDDDMMIVGSEWSTGFDDEGKPVQKSGSAYIFKKESGTWSYTMKLVPRPADTTAGAFFGQSVAIDKPYGREDLTALVGAPGQAKVYVFVLDPSTSSWKQQTVLEAHDIILDSEHRFGVSGAIALNDDLAFVGSAGVESVYIFQRSFEDAENLFKWKPWSMLRSSDYDFDVYDKGYTVRHIHRQDFGISLAASQRRLVVGAPYADYGNRGNVFDRETFNTDGVHNEGLGKGKVFVFFSQPHIQVVSLYSDEEPSLGSFRLQLKNHMGISNGVSGLIDHDASAFEMKLALEEASNIGEVEVVFNSFFDTDKAEKFTAHWTITFLSEVSDELPLLTPIWHNHGCSDCSPWGVSTLSQYLPRIKVESRATLGKFLEEDQLQANDRSSSDMFGHSLDLDGNQAIIGAMHSAARTRTTWDFETGDLTGWSSTGHAFDFQPTYGDNSRHRAVYSGFGSAESMSTGQPQSALLRGRYYIGTYEHRPGGGINNYQKPDSENTAGSFLGDKPTGTLTSDPFVILGDSITFLIGGGCNHLIVYVELLVDSYTSMRATGKCSERMEKVEWNVAEFIDRTAQIRIVDNGKERWGHINVDEIEFSWNIRGTCLEHIKVGCVDGGGALPRGGDGEKQHYTGPEETAQSGAAYLFHRYCGNLNDITQEHTCNWKQQERIVASDKREGNQFGISVSVNDSAGIAIVGSAYSPAYGFYQEIPSIYPHTNPTVIDFPVSPDLEDYTKDGYTHAATGGNLRVVEHLVKEKRRNLYDRVPEELFAEKFNSKAGAVYVFLRRAEKIGPDGEVEQHASWSNTECAKFSPPDVVARDKFGYSIALDGTTAIIGATGNDDYGSSGGAAYSYNMGWRSLRFTHTEFVALEGSDSEVKIYIQRSDDDNSDFTIGYSTSDLTATGVDHAKFNECQGLEVTLRDGCGDYEQASGTVTFLPGELSTYFMIKIMNDFCTERNMEYVQLNLHVPGGGPIHGERYRAQLRIDDDDWNGRSMSVNCTNGIS